NVPPTISAVSNSGPAVEGGSVMVTVTAGDVAGGNDPLSYEFDFNNDGVYEVGPQPGNTAAMSFATAGQFIVGVRVTNGDGGAATSSTTVTVEHINRAPVNIVPAAQKSAVNKPLVFSGARQISIRDDDAASSIVRVTLTATNGALTLGTTAGLASVSGN